MNVIDAAWQSPARQPRVPSYTAAAQPLVLVAEEAAVLTPMVEELCGFLRVRARRVAPGALAEALRSQEAVGVLCHAEQTGPVLAEALRAPMVEELCGFLRVRAVVAADPGLPVMVVTEQDASRQARLAVAAEILRLDHLMWLERLPDLRRMVDFLFLAERRASRGQGRERALPA